MDLAEWQQWWKRSGARQLRRLLMDEWDPLHASDAPEAADEYDGYLGPIASRLREGASPSQIAAYLTEVEEEQMGVGRSLAARARNVKVGELLHSWYAQAMTVTDE